jgi:hypothetical protein
MDTLQIELTGIIKLKDCLIRSDFLQPYMNENDKTPSWDGYIYVYGKQGKKKKDLLSRVSIQAKGKITDSIIGDKCNYPLNRSDLRNYLNDGGIILFVICMVNFDVYKIYYESLTQLKLKRYIKAMNDQESTTLSLSTFPKNNITELTDIFFNLQMR